MSGGKREVIVGRRQGEEECKKTEGMSEENLLKKTKKKKKKWRGRGQEGRESEGQVEHASGSYGARTGTPEVWGQRPGGSKYTWETDVRGVGDGREA